MSASGRPVIMVLGLGDLGSRILRSLGESRGPGHLIGVGRALAGRELLDLIAAAGNTRATFVPCDLGDSGALIQVLGQHRPDLVVQSACLLSPWWTFETPGPAARLLEQAGFGAQLPLQLSVLMSVMTACREVGLRAPIVNASYPDVTHAVLAPLGLGPTIGIGNVGIIAGLIRAASGVQASGGSDPFRLLAHHAHVWPALRGQWGETLAGRPRLWVGEPAVPQAEIPLPTAPLPLDRSINYLSAASALDIIAALLDSSPRRLHAPGPLGLPGGYPLQVGDGRVELDLPPQLTSQEAAAWLGACAGQEGIERIDASGTVHFTEVTCRILHQISPELAQPLSPERAPERARQLLGHLR
jgi:hypothetical protein